MPRDEQFGVIREVFDQGLIRYAPILGTIRVAHLGEAVAGAALTLSDADVARLVDASRAQAGTPA